MKRDHIHAPSDIFIYFVSTFHSQDVLGAPRGCPRFLNLRESYIVREFEHRDRENRITVIREGMHMSELQNEGTRRVAPAAMAVFVTLLMIISAIPAVAADTGETCEVTLVFVDQKGPLEDYHQSPETGNERVYVDYYGYKADGDTLTVTTGSTIYYTAYYKQYSGLTGVKSSFVATEDGDLEIEFRTVEFEFVDQFGEIVEPPATGNERAYVDWVGYVESGQKVVVPLGGMLNYGAYYKQYSGLKGPTESKTVGDKTKSVEVKFRTLDVDIACPTGAVINTPPATGNERVYIDWIGYVANGDQIVVPDESTIYYTAYFKQYSGLKGTENSLYVEAGVTEVVADFAVIPINFLDQYGDLDGTGNERVYIDWVGYKADGEFIVVPSGGTLTYTSYFKQYSGLKGLPQTIAVDDLNCDPEPAPAPACDGTCEDVTVSWTGEDTTTKGDWVGSYGDYAHILPSAPVNRVEIPAGDYGLSTPISGYTDTWGWTSSQLAGLASYYKPSPTYWDEYVSDTPAVTYSVAGTEMPLPSSGPDERALETPDESQRRAACYWSNTAETVTLTVPSGFYQMAVYLVDWDSTARAETLSVTDSTGTVAPSVSGFNGGVYEVFDEVRLRQRRPHWLRHHHQG
jgi:hypothetical protein